MEKKLDQKMLKISLFNFFALTIEGQKALVDYPTFAKSFP